jgi:isocitrate dehydrogenase
MITNRGIKVYPDGFPETFCTDHWRCRFKPTEGNVLTKAEIIELLQRAEARGIDVIKTENLYTFDGKAAYSLGQGQ